MTRDRRPPVWCLSRARGPAPSGSRRRPRPTGPARSDRRLLRLNGVPVGRFIGNQEPPLPWESLKWFNSIVVILATNAPLLPVQCRRLARQSVVGFARVGGIGYNADGDFFLAFSTGNHLPHTPSRNLVVEMLPNRALSALFIAAAEAVEEAIWNSMTTADTMIGFQGRIAYALPLERVVEIMERSGEG